MFVIYFFFLKKKKKNRCNPPFVLFAHNYTFKQNEIERKIIISYEIDFKLLLGNIYEAIAISDKDQINVLHSCDQAKKLTPNFPIETTHLFISLQKSHKENKINKKTEYIIQV